MERLSAGHGHLELICGCMFSGKSEHLVERVNRARSQGLAVAVFKHASDDRYAREAIVTHGGLTIEAVPVPNAAALFDRVGDAPVVVIDEAQFFDDGLVVTCRHLKELGKKVLVAGLDRDSWGQPFGPMPAIEAIADTVTRTRAVCARCGEPAEYTQRLRPVGPTTMVGGSESYEPRCAQCFKAPPIELRR